MSDAHQVVAAYWAAAESRDWDTFAGLVAEQVVYDAPQFRERVRGRSAYVRFNVEGFPATGISTSSGSSGRAATRRAGSSSLIPVTTTRGYASSTSMRTGGSPG
jgi:SnoaL-like domain